MTTGNRDSIVLMTEYILWDLEVRKSTDIRREVILEQMSKEYAYPIAELEKDLEKLDTIRARCGFPMLAYVDMEKDGPD